MNPSLFDNFIQLRRINVDQEIFDHVEKRIGESNAAFYGRVTFQMMENYWPTAGDKPAATKHDIEHAKWYAKAQKIVLSKTLQPATLVNTTIISDNIFVQINEIKRQSGSEILVFGSPSATHSLIQQNLIDGFWLFVNPVILGQGIPLFLETPHKTKLQLLSTQQFKCGVTELNYMINK